MMFLMCVNFFFVIYIGKYYLGILFCEIFLICLLNVNVFNKILVNLI